MMKDIKNIAFLPLRLVENEFKFNKINLIENFMDLLHYFDAYYVNGKYQRIENDTNNLRYRKLPQMFPKCRMYINLPSKIATEQIISLKDEIIGFQN